MFGHLIEGGGGGNNSVVYVVFFALSKVGLNIWYSFWCILSSRLLFLRTATTRVIFLQNTKLQQVNYCCI